MYTSSEAYSEQIAGLRLRILDKLEDIQSSRSSQYTIREWFDFAYKFWEFTKSFSSIIEYQNL